MGHKQGLMREGKATSLCTPTQTSVLPMS
jgi:hypothetical protein